MAQLISDSARMAQADALPRQRQCLGHPSLHPFVPLCATGAASARLVRLYSLAPIFIGNIGISLVIISDLGLITEQSPGSKLFY
jgi:hypothetical protein